MNVVCWVILTNFTAILLCIDIQGKLAQKAVTSQLLHAKTGVLVQGCSILEVPVVYTEQVPDKLGPTSPDLKDLLEKAGAKRFEKRTFSCISEAVPNENSEIRNIMKGKDVLICGIESHICVMQTVLELMSVARSVYVVVDAVSAQKQLDMEIGIKRMEKAGAVLTTTESILFEMMKVADLQQGSKFRSVSKLLV